MKQLTVMPLHAEFHPNPVIPTDAGIQPKPVIPADAGIQFAGLIAVKTHQTHDLDSRVRGNDEALAAGMTKPFASNPKH